MKYIIALATITTFSLAGINRDPMYKWYEGLDPKNVLYAVNCGNDDTITDVGGIEYLSDRGFSGG